LRWPLNDLVIIAAGAIYARYAKRNAKEPELNPSSMNNVMDKLFLLLEPCMRISYVGCLSYSGDPRENERLNRRCMQHICDRFLDCKAYPQNVRFMVLSTIAKLCLHIAGYVSPQSSIKNVGSARYHTQLDCKAYHRSVCFMVLLPLEGLCLQGNGY
jgi:hypothetical protein